MPRARRLNLRKNLMTLVVNPELGVPLSSVSSYVDLIYRAEYACNTASKLAEHGLNIEPTAEDKDVAAKLAISYADNPEKTSKKVTAKRASTLTPASLLMTNSILQEFGQSVAESAVQIRQLDTNKLVLEAENPDARVRIRALELLGKISDVGLFSEKSEITVTHQSTEDLKENLRAKLAKLVNPEESKPVTLDGEVIDVDEELGLSEKPENKADAGE